MLKCHCGKYALFNFNGQKPIFCSKHKEPNMINVKNRICEVNGCNIIPYYNFLGEKKGRLCSKHKLDNMINITKYVICEINGCETRPSYNFLGEKKGRFCAKHKELTMINVINISCEIDNCRIIPYYNFPGEKHGRFCTKHKKLNMIDVKNKKCEVDDCDIIPIYNFSTEKKGRFCAKHKEPTMINVKFKVCENNDCIMRPSYNFNGEKYPRFCSKHALPNMINVKHKICEATNCIIQSSYNFSGEKKGRFCIKHKEPNMIDITHIICKHNDCNTRASYGFLGKSALYCAKHAQKSMISHPTKKCETPKCKELGCYELNGSRFCDDHKPNGSNNLGIEKCTSCYLDDILVNGKCSTCDPDIIKLRKHAKENRVRDILTIAGFKFVHDKMLEDSTCGEERPDFQIDCGTHFLYIEVDENQHQTYQCVCEQTRMINLVEVRGMPVRFIRYNPDYYEPLPEQMYVTIEKREKKLIEYVKYAMKHSPVENGNLADALYLFYNEYNTTSQEWMKLV
jgi:hypothetical protein